MSQSKPFTLRMKKVGVDGKVTWLEQSFATASELGTYYEKNSYTPRAKKTKRGGKKRNKNKGQ